MTTETRQDTRTNAEMNPYSDHQYLIEIENGKAKAMNIILHYVVDTRTAIEYDLAEKYSQTYRVTANSWKEAKEMFEEVDFYHGDALVDGSWTHIKEYAPRYQKKVQQIKIRHRWYDLDDIRNDIPYLVNNDYNLTQALSINDRKAINVLVGRDFS